MRPLSDEEILVLARLREVYRSRRKENVPSLKSRDQKKVMGKIYLINGLIGNISKSYNSISNVNQLLYACSYVVAEELGLMKKKKGERKAKEDPRWKRRIEKNPSHSERKRLDQKYDLTLKGANDVCSSLKSKI